MSTTAVPAWPPDAATAWGSARIFAGTGAGRLDLARHREVHGRPRRLGAAALADDLAQVRLLGRGGAAFPVASKLRGLEPGRRTQVLVNGCEGKPASHKDRVLMRLAPHLVLDGALAVAAALGAPTVTVAVQDRTSHASLAAALRERDDAGGVRLQRYDHGFVGGEVRALVRAVSGGPAVPPGRRVLPTVHGVAGRPTFASNVETFAQVALVLILGVEAYAGVGSADEPGTTLLTLLGDVPHRGVVEVPTGLPLAALTGSAPGPVLVGGYHGTWISTPTGLTVSRPALRAAGAPLNAGVLARLPSAGCALGEVAAVTHWLAEQSTGQCGPCRLGLPALASAVDGLAAGCASLPAVTLGAQRLRGRGACAHPDGSSAFVVSALAALADEVAVHRDRGDCGRPYLGVLPTAAAGGRS